MAPTKELNRFAEEVMEVMPLMVREFAKREDNALIHGKISCPQMVVLHHTADHGEVTVSEIAKILSIEKSSASVLLERLVKQGMMKRRHDSKDRRLVWVGITPKGKKVVSQIMMQKKQSLKAIFGKLSITERSQYLSVLKKVKSNLAKGAALCVLSGLLFSQEAHAFLWWGKKEASQSPAPQAETSQSATTTLTLHEAFSLAVERSESLAITAQEMDLAQARFYRSFNYFLPQVRYEITRFQQDVDDDRSGGGDDSFNSGRQITPAQKFVFSQPLFSGFREIAALQGSGADKKAQRMKYDRARELLFVDVMEAYYTVLNGEKDLETLYAVHRLMSERMRDLRERVDLGRSRDSELKTSLADIKILESDLLEAKRSVRAARNLLEFYIGKETKGMSLVQDNGEEADPVFEPGKEQARSDIQQLEQEYIVAKNKVVAANANFFPIISLDGNYYTKRVGYQSGNDWDVLLTFDIPVFEVGDTLGDVKEAAATREQARLAYEEKKRLASLEARDAFEEFESDMQSELALADASKASSENYALLQKEFSTNLVNNLEVLDSLRRYQDTQRRYERARYDAKKSYWRLKLALGEIPDRPA